MQPDIAVDGTDHFTLYCRACAHELRRIVITLRTHRNKIASVAVCGQCPQCKKRGRRKIYTKDANVGFAWASMTNIERDVSAVRRRKSNG